MDSQLCVSLVSSVSEANNKQLSRFIYKYCAFEVVLLLSQVYKMLSACLHLVCRYTEVNLSTMLFLAVTSSFPTLC